MKVIPTEYNGYRFRSRLEARWAVFMDVLKVPFLYDPDAYEFNGVGYLPDFFIPSIGAFLEIKPVKPAKSEQVIYSSLAQFTKQRVFLAHQAPELPACANDDESMTCFFPEGGEDYNHDTPTLRAAYTIAKGYRFEPGAHNPRA